MASFIDIPASTMVMSRSGLKYARDIKPGDSVLTADCVFDRVEQVEFVESDSDALHLKAFVSGGFDVALPSTPYLTYNRKTGVAFYDFARNLRIGSPILSCRPTMKYARTCYSMDMEDFVTGFGGLKSVTFNSCMYTLRQVGDVSPFQTPILVARIRLRGSSTVQTENGVVKAWGA